MIIVMQGRIRSSRLPGKGFFTFFGQTLWERACDIAMAVRGAERVIFATGDLPENQLIRPLVEAKGVEFVVGSERHVLQRFCRAIEDYRGEYLMRLTCDNYLAQPEVMEGVYAATLAAHADYGYIKPLSHYGAEVIRCESLRRCLSGRYSAEAMEHVTWDIRLGSEYTQVSEPEDYMGLDHSHSLTLDTVEDLILMKHVERDVPQLEPVRCLGALHTYLSGALTRWPLETRTSSHG